ncbi:MAG TPA: chemotaxis protein CheB [Burkholderiales bacterium]|nr:chemotaxis protein CheB [Burkholderiales bacterium]
MAASAPSRRSDPEGAGRDIVVVGTSAGGADALLRLFKQLPRDLPAAFFVTYHLIPGARAVIADLLLQAGSLRPKLAEDGEPIRRGVIYVARPDRHLIVKRGEVRVTRGPRENRWRPAIDPLFRSAAVAYRSRVIGIVLTGMLDDGTAGLLAIKRCGGISVVQDPLDAAYPEMPQSALDNVDIDYRLPIADMGQAIIRLVAEPPGPPPEVPREILEEARASEEGTPIQFEPTNDGTELICPECGGPLHEQQHGPMKRYRCLVGHGWSPQTLLSSTSESVESTLWAAIRLFRQRANLVNAMAKREREAGRETLAIHYENVATEALGHAGRLQDMAMRSVDLTDRPS